MCICVGFRTAHTGAPTAPPPPRPPPPKTAAELVAVARAAPGGLAYLDLGTQRVRAGSGLVSAGPAACLAGELVLLPGMFGMPAQARTQLIANVDATLPSLFSGLPGGRGGVAAQRDWHACADACTGDACRNRLSMSDTVFLHLSGRQIRVAAMHVWHARAGSWPAQLLCMRRILQLDARYYPGCSETARARQPN